MQFKGFEIFVTCKRLETWTVDRDGRPLEFDDEHEMEVDDYFVNIPEKNDDCVSYAELRADTVKELKKLINEHLKANA